MKTPEEIERLVKEGGRKGGLARNKKKGFGSNKDLAREAGKRGAEARWGKNGKV